MPPRFNTDRAIFETFPTARRDVGVEPGDVSPVVLAQDLIAKKKLNEAVALCAYLLPRRDAVIWGCRTLRALLKSGCSSSTPSLRAAEDWIARSDDVRQAFARKIGAEADDSEPSTWMARAVGWCGGTVAPNVAIPVPPQLTAVGVQVGITIALHRVPALERLAQGQACVEDALRMVEQDG